MHNRNCISNLKWNFPVYISFVVLHLKLVFVLLFKHVNEQRIEHLTSGNDYEVYIIKLALKVLHNIRPIWNNRLDNTLKCL
jgi:hypothetical protein